MSKQQGWPAPPQRQKPVAHTNQSKLQPPGSTMPPGGGGGGVIMQQGWSLSPHGCAMSGGGVMSLGGTHEPVTQTSPLPQLPFAQQLLFTVWPQGVQ
jgi:hypothetical protein